MFNKSRQKRKTCRGIRRVGILWLWSQINNNNGNDDDRKSYNNFKNKSGTDNNSGNNKKNNIGWNRNRRKKSVNRQTNRGRRILGWGWKFFVRTEVGLRFHPRRRGHEARRLPLRRGHGLWSAHRANLRLRWISHQPAVRPDGCPLPQPDPAHRRSCPRWTQFWPGSRFNSILSRESLCYSSFSAVIYFIQFWNQRKYF